LAYLGNRPAESFASFEKQVFTIVNSQTAYTLSHSVTNENDIRLVVNSVVQEPGSGKAYTASGTTLTLSAALTNGTDTMYCVFLGRALQTVNAPNASVGSDQTAPTIITGQTAETSIATDDTILIHDTSASALRKMTRANFVSGIGGDNTPMFLVSGGSGNQTISHASGTTIAYAQEIIDTDNAFASNIFTVPSGEAGKYFFSASCQIEDTQADIQRFILEIQKNDSSWRQIAHRFTSNQDLMQVSHTVTAIDDASVGDTYKAKVYVETADGGSVIIENGSTSYSNNWFQGFKLL
jgi:hypothetical protein